MCQVTDFEYFPILLPDSPILNKSGLHAPYVPRIIMRVELSDGSIGWSEVPCNKGMLLVLKNLLPIVKGTIANIEEIQKMLLKVVENSKQTVTSMKLADKRGDASFDQGVTNHIRAGIQMACYDALAKHRSLTLADLLAGGERLRDEVNFNLYLFWIADTAASGLTYQGPEGFKWNHSFAEYRDRPALSIDDAVSLALAAEKTVMPGVGLMKWKFGVFEPVYEAQLLLALDEAFNYRMRFVPDPNGAWDVKTAVGITKKLKSVLGSRLPYVEDLVMGREAMAEVFRQTGVLQATNMCAANIDEHQLAVDMQAIQITLGGDVHYMAGSDIAVELSRLCRDKWKIGFAQHSNSHTEISLMHTVAMGAAASEHNWPFDTHYFPWQSGRGLTTSPIVAENGGIVRVIQKPGIGIDVDLKRLKYLHQLFLTANSCMRRVSDRDDGPAADMVFGKWIRPGSARSDQWFMAGVQS